MWNILKFSKTGTRNEKSGLKCQDYIYDLANGPIQAITLADGTGEDNFARMGAKHSSRILAELLTEHFEELYDMEKALVQFHIITNVQTELYGLCEEYGLDLKDLHSTLIGIAVDHEGERFLAVHLGDGSIGVRRKEKAMVMSYPENGRDRSRTYLTSEHRVGKHIRIYRGRLGDIQEFMLVSDGWNEKLPGQSPLIGQEQIEKAERTDYTDDISFIALKKK